MNVLKALLLGLGIEKERELNFKVFPNKKFVIPWKNCFAFFLTFFVLLKRNVDKTIVTRSNIYLFLALCAILILLVNSFVHFYKVLF